MRRLILILVLLLTGSIIPLAGFVPTIYYIANAPLGNDANNCTSKATPCEHLRGMPTCTANCAAITPQPGDQFILRGGDTWNNADLGMSWVWNGTSGSRIYIGVDQTWYAGAFWTRPIFTCGGAICTSNAGFSYAQLQVYGAYVTVDNIEFTGLYADTGALGPASIALAKGGAEVKNCYFHGWAHSAVTNTQMPVVISSDLGQSPPSIIHDNVIDGSDTSRDMMVGIWGGGSIYNNVLRYIPNGVGGLVNDMHGNFVEHIVNNYTGLHCDGLASHSPYSGEHVLDYNNVIQHFDCGGGIPMWVMQNNGCTSVNGPFGCTHFAFNNLIYDSDTADPILEFAGHKPSIGGSCDFGTLYAYNNTVVSLTALGNIMGNGESTNNECTPNYRGILHYANNHGITNTGAICQNAGILCINDGGSGDTSNLKQTTTQVAVNYNSATAPEPYSPANASAEGIPPTTSTLNMTAFIAAVTAVDATAGAAAANAMTCAVGYDTLNHTVIVPGCAATARTVASPNAGAYEFSGSTPAATITSFTKSGDICSGSSATLTWTTANADTLTIAGLSTFGPNTNTAVSPKGTTIYSATATGTGGSSSPSTVTVGVGCPIKGSLPAGVAH